MARSRASQVAVVRGRRGSVDAESSIVLDPRDLANRSCEHNVSSSLIQTHIMHEGGPQQSAWAMAKVTAAARRAREHAAEEKVRRGRERARERVKIAAEAKRASLQALTSHESSTKVVGSSNSRHRHRPAPDSVRGHAAAPVGDIEGGSPVQNPNITIASLATRIEPLLVGKSSHDVSAESLESVSPKLAGAIEGRLEEATCDRTAPSSAQQHLYSGENGVSGVQWERTPNRQGVERSSTTESRPTSVDAGEEVEEPEPGDRGSHGTARRGLRGEVITKHSENAAEAGLSITAIMAQNQALQDYARGVLVASKAR